MGSSSLLEGTRSGSECEDTGAKTWLRPGIRYFLFSQRQTAVIVERLVGWHLPAGAQMLPLLETSKQPLLLE